MKKLLMALLVLSLTSGIAAADTYIGLFAVPHATSCYGDTGQYTTTTVYVIAWLDQDWSGLVSAAEFHIENYPATGAMGIVTENWNTDLVIGFPSYGIALAFADPLQGPLALLGSIDFYPIDPNWIPADYVMAVRPSRASDMLALADTGGNEYQVGGGQYTFNCGAPGTCDCLESVAVQDANWGSVKALY